MTAIAERLGLTAHAPEPTFLHVARAFTESSSRAPLFTADPPVHFQEAAAVQAFKTAAEPDSLIFETLPVLLDSPPSRHGARERKDADAFAAWRDPAELGQPKVLLEEIWRQLAEATGVWGEPP